MTSLSRKDWILLIFLTLCWGFNWPIMKFGVQDFPPVTFRALAMLLALPIMWIAARVRHTSTTMPSGTFVPILKLAIPNMAIWNILIILGIQLLSSGRAAILGYTMPIWAVIFAWALVNEKPSKIAWFGIACAATGAALLLSSEFAAISGKPVGTIMMLVAAASWGYGTVNMKYQVIPMPTLSITLWMIGIGGVILAVYAILFETHLWKMPNALQWAAILYNAILVFGFANVIWVDLARTLPPVASSLSVMMIPVVGVFSGAWMLSETPHWQDYAAMVLILAAISSVLLKPGSSVKK